MTKEERYAMNDKARKEKRYSLFVDGKIIANGNTRSYMVKRYATAWQENKGKRVYLWDDWNSCEI